MNLSIKFKITLAAFVFVTALYCVQLVFVTPKIMQQEIDEATVHQQSFTEQVARHYDDVFERTIYELEAIASLPEIRSFDKQTIDGVLTKMNKVNTFFNYFFVLDSSAKYFSYPSRESRVGKSITNRAWVEECLSKNTTIFLDVVVSRSGALVSGFATPIRNEDNEPIGVLRGVIRVSENNTLLSSIDDVKYGEHGYGFLVASNGWLLAHPDHELNKKDSTVYNFSHYAPVSKVMNRESGSIAYNYDGIDTIATYQSIPSTGWGLIVQQEEGKITKFAHERINTLVFILSGFFLCVVVIIYLVTQYTLSPLLKLTRAIKKGELDDHRDYPPDEIGQIADEFDSLYRKQNETNQKLLQEIEERRSTQASLALAKEAADKANAAKSEFLANMSHEIRTPMNAISGFSELLSKAELPEKVSNYVSMIQSSSTRLLDLINSILDFSKVEARKLELNSLPLQIHSVVDECISVFSIDCQEKGISLNSEIGDTVPQTLYGDTNRLLQVLVNIVGNAVKFTEGGYVRLSVDLEKIIHAEDDSSDDVDKYIIRFVVKDSGIGISSKAQENIFELFTQADSSTSRKYGGTGLGLAISANLVKLMGGGIHVKSQAGEGAEFVFTACFTDTPGKSCGISPTEDTDKDPCLVDQPSPTINLADYKILLAEDEQINRELVETFFQEHGAKIYSVTNGQEAIELTEESHFHLILMDIQMPVLGGDEAIRKIRKKEEQTGSHMPIIALTAHAIRGDREKYLKMGADDYVTKPINFDVLLHTISKLLLTD